MHVRKVKISTCLDNTRVVFFFVKNFWYKEFFMG